MDLDRARTRLRGLIRPETFGHSLAVSEAAARWAPSFGADPDAACWAGLLHDCAKGLPPQAYLDQCQAASIQLYDAERASPPVLHQRLGALWAATRFGVEDPMVLAAIRCHTTGADPMDGLARCLFVIDWVSPDRTYPGVETLRAAVDRSPEEGFLAVLGAKQQEVRARRLPEHPWARAACDRWLESG